MNSGNISNEEQKNSKLENIKSAYIIKKIIGYMNNYKALKIIKYNKNIQKRLFFNLNTYKYYSYSKTPIEIVIKFAINEYAKFINISNEDMKYYHIYFNNSNEEIKRTFLKDNEKVDCIKIKIDPPIQSFKKLFYNCTSIISIKFEKFYKNNITDMSQMFFGCTSLKELIISSFNSDNVTDMSEMFFGCIH